MKKTLIIAAAVAVATVSCQNEKLGTEQSRSIKVAAETLPVTKASFQDGIDPIWTVGETASLISVSDYSIKASSSLESSNIAADGSKAWFIFDTVDDGSYRIVSPTPSSASESGVVFSISASQTQDELGISGSRACLVGGLKAGDGVLSDIEVSTGTTLYEAYFKLAGALLQFNIYDSSNPTGEQIKSVTVTATDANLSGDITVGYDGGFQSVAQGGNSVTVTVGNPEIVVADKASAKGIYAAIVPVTVLANESGSVKYTIITDGSAYEFTSKSGKDWKNGFVNPISIDLACATKIERQAPIMSSTHPQATGDFTMTETEPGVYTVGHIWLSGQDYSIYFAAGNSGFYYNALNGWVSSEDCEFDVVYSNEPVALNIQQYGGKNYSEKYYTVILNTNTMKLKMVQDKGERFWIAGDNLSWDLMKYEMDVDQASGKAVWSGYLKSGSFKIHGENLWFDEEGNATWTGPNNKTGAGEWYFLDDSRENGISMNADADKKWNISEAGYYSLEFDYKSSPMTFTVTKEESLSLKVNGKEMTYSGSNEYSITTTFTQGEDFVLSGCKNLEYVKMDPDFLKDGKFNAVDGTYTFILHLQSHDATWTADGQTPTNSWTLFKGIKTDGVYSTLILSGEGVANLSINSCVGWTCEAQNQPFMAEVEDNVYQFTGRYKESWWHLEPYDRWASTLKFKYYGNIWWGAGIVNGVNLVDNTGKISQLSSGDLSWTSSSEKWEDWGTYRMTVDMNTDPQTVTFDKL